jgi:hypothetical protein
MIEEIQENATRELCAITESAFQEAFQQWKKCWEWGIASRGDYFEGDCLKCKMSNKVFIAKVRSCFEHALYVVAHKCALSLFPFPNHCLF